MDIIKNLEKEAESLKSNIGKSKETLRKQQQRIKHLKKFVYDCVQLIQNHTELKNKLCSFKRLVRNEDQISKEIEEEYQAQIKYLLQNIKEFTVNIKKDTHMQKINNRNHIEENVKLIKDVENLRRELKNFKTCEKPEKIELRKEKKMSNILLPMERKLDYQQKEELIETLEQQILPLKKQYPGLYKKICKNIKFKV
jgi:hypothetical protein